MSENMQEHQYRLTEVHLVADTGVRPGGVASQPYLLLDRKGDRYYTKIQNHPAPGSSLASEVICYWLLKYLLLADFEPYLGFVEFELRDKYALSAGGIFVSSGVTATGEAGVISRGPHYATQALDDAFVVSDLTTIDLEHPADAVALWVFDTWLGIIDRTTPGNLLTCRIEGNKSVLHPIDNGAAFFGPEWRGAGLDKLAAEQRAVEAVKGTMDIVYRRGIGVILDAVGKLGEITDEALRGVLASPPDEWGFTPQLQQQAYDYLCRRRDILVELCVPEEVK